MPSALASEEKDLPEFGHSLLSKFLLDKDYINLNNGSFGALPKAVYEECEILARKTEEKPDKALRYDYIEPLKEARRCIARLIGAHTDEVVLVMNATHGVNVVLRNFDWNAKDVIVRATYTYEAVSRTIQYLHDCSPHPSISVINMSFPITHDEIVEKLRDHIRGIPRHDGQKVVVIIDSITSTPGCRMPWKRMVQVCKEENVWNVVDAAHSFGHEMDINLNEVQPDFWISNCHKWFYAKRPCGVLYVPFRNQQMIRSSIPTSWSYVSPEDPDGPEKLKSSSFVAQHAWNGTIDFVPFFSVLSALKFREQLGGGERVAQLLQTSVLPEELTANMCNIVLPLPVPPEFSPEKLMEIGREMGARLIEEWNCFVPVFAYDGKWWARCSAQVFNEVSDFDHIAKALKAICQEARHELRKSEVGLNSVMAV